MRQKKKGEKMLVRLDNIIYNLSRWDSFFVQKADSIYKDRISFLREGVEVEYHAFESLDAANEAFGRFPCSNTTSEAEERNRDD